MQGVPIGLKYTGQPNTCFKCGLPDDLVKNCPKRAPPHGEATVQRAPHASMRTWGDTALPGPPIPATTTDNGNAMDTTPAPESETPPSVNDSSDPPPNTTSGSEDASQPLFTQSGSSTESPSPSPSQPNASRKRDRPPAQSDEEADNAKDSRSKHTRFFAE